MCSMAGIGLVFAAHDQHYALLRSDNHTHMAPRLSCLVQ